MGGFEVADVIRLGRPRLERAVRLSARQKATLTSLTQCRTEALGGAHEYCGACDFEHNTYPSCRNRHCSKCQGLDQEEWIDSQRERTLDVQHFHLVFTLPSELRGLTRFAPDRVYNLLLKTVGETLKDFAEVHWNATLGATLVLHTWNRKLEFHPHVHAIVTGGGVVKTEKKVHLCESNFIFPVGALRTVFRGKLTEALKIAYEESAFSHFSDFEDPEGFSRLMKPLFEKTWCVYAKPAFDRAEHVLQYLGRYTHRVGISKSRLLSVTETAVTFRTRGSQTETITPAEFTRRLVLHVLPKGFHKIRHIGLNASPKKRALMSRLLNLTQVVRIQKDWRQRYLELTGRDVHTCPKCGAVLRGYPLPRAASALRPVSPRAPPPST